MLCNRSEREDRGEERVGRFFAFFVFFAAKQEFCVRLSDFGIRISFGFRPADF